MTLPVHDDYRRPAFSPTRIRNGVDLCRAALVKAQAIRDGVDPDDAADLAEGEAGAQREIRSRPCRHCCALADRPCLRVGAPVGTEPTIPGFHDSRVQDWQNGVAA